MTHRQREDSLAKPADAKPALPGPKPKLSVLGAQHGSTPDLRAQTGVYLDRLGGQTLSERLQHHIQNVQTSQ